MIKENKEYTEKNNRSQLKIEFANKFKYIVKKCINKNIFRDEGLYDELENFGIKFYSSKEYIINFNEIKTIMKVKVFIDYKERITFCYLNKNFNLINSLYFEKKYLCYEKKDYYLDLIKYIEEIYEKMKLNEEVEKELNKKTTQRKRVKI